MNTNSATTAVKAFELFHKTVGRGGLAAERLGVSRAMLYLYLGGAHPRSQNVSRWRAASDETVRELGETLMQIEGRHATGRRDAATRLRTGQNEPRHRTATRSGRTHPRGGMNIGLLPFDDSQQKTFAQKVEEAAASHTSRYGVQPDTAFVNPAMSGEKTVGGVSVKNSPGILNNHIWIGVNDAS